MILILKTGSTLASISERYGDFEDWFAAKMQLAQSEYHVHPAGDYNHLPPEQHYSGIIITGSPFMVTEIKIKDSKLGNWLLHRQNTGTPVLGICFGHQLLNILNGGTVYYNPSGRIIGMEKTTLTAAGQQDSLLGALPSDFLVYKSHSQCVHTLPETAEILALSNSGIIDGIKFNENTWGLQFHPEFDSDITKRYIQENADGLIGQGLDVQELLKNVVNVNHGETILKHFDDIMKNYDKL
jgi:GMP synthase (glutamine-hydrolysing)